MYLCGSGKHSCQPFCGPEGRFYCSDSVCSLWPAPFSYLCVSVMILCVCWKLSAAEQVKTDCCNTPAVVSTLLTPLPVSCPLTTPHHYIYVFVGFFILSPLLVLTAVLLLLLIFFLLSLSSFLFLSISTVFASFCISVFRSFSFLFSIHYSYILTRQTGGGGIKVFGD